MNRLIEPLQTHITANGKEYALNTDYRAAINTILALKKAENGELSALAVEYVAIYYMLGVNADDIEMADMPEMSKGISDYLKKYASGSKETKAGNKPPMLSFEQDAQMMYDAFLAAGHDLDKVDMSYAKFMSIIHELPENCQLCRIIYLRNLIYSGKIGKKEYKAERDEIDRRGRDVVYIQSKKPQITDEEYEKTLVFDELFEKGQAERLNKVM